MSTRPVVLHLLDDATPGGVTRVLEQIQTCPQLGQRARHELRIVPRKGALPTCRADMIVSHLSLSWRSLPRLISLRARHASTPLVHVEHSYTEAFAALNVPSRLRFFAMLRSAYALFETVVAVSEAQGAWLVRRRLVQASALHVIPPAVDLTGFRALTAPVGAPRVIGAIGRLHRQKGFDVLIRAFRDLPDPDLSLHVYGTGPEETALRALPKDDRRIRFFGHVGSATEAMSAVDIVAMPSRWEAYGLVALEARACGRPIVCADVDGLLESAGPEATFVRGHDVARWTAALNEAVIHPARPSKAADLVEQDFAAAWSEILSGIQKGNRPAPLLSTTTQTV